MIYGADVRVGRGSGVFMICMRKSSLSIMPGGCLTPLQVEFSLEGTEAKDFMLRKMAF